MKSSAGIRGVNFKIDGDILSIGGWQFNRRAAPEVIAFIQQWLDHDPEEELRERVKQIRRGDGMGFDEETKSIIAAVREHDRKYGKP